MTALKAARHGAERRENPWVQQIDENDDQSGWRKVWSRAGERVEDWQVEQLRSTSRFRAVSPAGVVGEFPSLRQALDAYPQLCTVDAFVEIEADLPGSEIFDRLRPGDHPEGAYLLSSDLRSEYSVFADHGRLASVDVVLWSDDSDWGLCSASWGYVGGSHSPMAGDGGGEELVGRSGQYVLKTSLAEDSGDSDANTYLGWFDTEEQAEVAFWKAQASESTPWGANYSLTGSLSDETIVELIGLPVPAGCLILVNGVFWHQTSDGPVRLTSRGSRGPLAIPSGTVLSVFDDKGARSGTVNQSTQAKEGNADAGTIAGVLVPPGDDADKELSLVIEAAMKLSGGTWGLIAPSLLLLEFPDGTGRLGVVAFNGGEANQIAELFGLNTLVVGQDETYRWEPQPSPLVVPRRLAEALERTLARVGG